MSVFVYERSLEYSSGSSLLKEVRRIVRQLKKSEPSLKHCSLADVALKRDKACVNVTFFFQS